MKIKILLTTLTILSSVYLKAQDVAIRSPKVMVMPTDQWMYNNGFLNSDKIADYSRAFIESPQLSFLTVQLNSSLTSQGITVRSLEENIKNIDYETIQTSVSTGKDGNEVNNPLLDQILQKAKPDLLVKVNWPKDLKVGAAGKRYMEITLEIVNAYTSIALSSMVLRSPEGMMDINKSIEGAIEGGIMDVEAKLRTFYDKMITNGRSIELFFKTSGNLTFEAEFGDDYEELSDIIKDWIVENAVNGQANHGRSTPTEYACSPKISLKYQDAEDFVRPLRLKLRKEYQIKVRRISIGPGKCNLILSKS